MVTFAAATKNSPSFPTRAPAQCRVTHFVAITCSVPIDSCDLLNADCRTHAQLVSPSRDPIGFVDRVKVAGDVRVADYIALYIVTQVVDYSLWAVIELEK